MNDIKRARLADAMAHIMILHHVVDDILDEEQEDFDNLPPGPQASPIGEEMEEAIEVLGKISEDLGDALAEIGTFLGIEPEEEAETSVTKK